MFSDIKDLPMQRRLEFKNTDWPTMATPAPVVADQFAATKGIPEVTPDGLTVDTLHSAIKHHGALLVRKLLPETTVDLLVKDIDAAFNARLAFRKGSSTEWFHPFEEMDVMTRSFAQTGGGVLVVDSPRSMVDLLKVFDDTDITDLVGSYLRERPALLAKKWTLRKIQPKPTEAGWHQDGAFMGDRIKSLNVWMALSHCGKDAPGLDIVAKRLDKIVRTGTSGAYFSWSVGSAEIEKIGRKHIVSPIFAPGDALLFDHFNLHRTGTGPGLTKARYAIESWFMAPSTYKHMKQDQIPIAF